MAPQRGDFVASINKVLPAGTYATNQVLTLIEELADLPFVGMDCVEVAPPYDHAELTANAAAHFVWTYLCGRVAAQRGSA